MSRLRLNATLWFCLLILGSLPHDQLIPVELPHSSVLVPIKALDQKLLGTASIRLLDVVDRQVCGETVHFFGVKTLEMRSHCQNRWKLSETLNMGGHFSSNLEICNERRWDIFRPLISYLSQHVQQHRRFSSRKHCTSSLGKLWLRFINLKNEMKGSILIYLCRTLVSWHQFNLTRLKCNQFLFFYICYTCPEGVALCICTCRQNDSEWFFSWRPCGFYTTVSPNQNTLAESIKLSVYSMLTVFFSKKTICNLLYTALQLYIDLHNL